MSKLNKLLRRTKGTNKRFKARIAWVKSVNKLRQLYARFTARQIAEIMGCSCSAMRSKIHLLGLRKETDVTKEDRYLILKLIRNDYQRRSERHFVAASVFDKGQISNAAVAVM